MSRPLLRPMPPDGLQPRPAPQAAASREEIRLIEAAPAVPEPSLRPASFAPAQPQPEAMEQSLLGGFLLVDDEDDDPDDLPDAVPSEQMPSPACVPLFELPGQKPPRRRLGRKRD